MNVTSSLQPALNRPVLRLKPSLRKQSQDSPRYKRDLARAALVAVPFRVHHVRVTLTLCAGVPERVHELVILSLTHTYHVYMCMYIMFWPAGHARPPWAWPAPQSARQPHATYVAVPGHMAWCLPPRSPTLFLPSNAKSSHHEGRHRTAALSPLFQKVATPRATLVPHGRRWTRRARVLLLCVQAPRATRATSASLTAPPDGLSGS